MHIGGTLGAGRRCSAAGGLSPNAGAGIRRSGARWYSPRAVGGAAPVFPDRAQVAPLSPGGRGRASGIDLSVGASSP